MTTTAAATSSNLAFKLSTKTCEDTEKFVEQLSAFGKIFFVCFPINMINIVHLKLFKEEYD